MTKSPEEWLGCFECKHLRPDEGAVCDAFPQGIPIEIASGQIDHLEPRKGDHGIQFEPRKDQAS
jgi:hypothetical protein